VITFLTFLGASALGTFLGNWAIFWMIGRMAKKAEMLQIREMERVREEYAARMKRETERMEKYAKLEG
jgi:membrane protein DedA with SNARE-associated domain